jgi:hypothetical protein
VAAELDRTALGPGQTPHQHPPIIPTTHHPTSGSTASAFTQPPPPWRPSSIAALLGWDGSHTRTRAGPKRGVHDRLQAVDRTDHQSSDELVWHNQYRLDRTLASVCWQAETLGHLLGIPVAPVICVHGAQVQHGRLRAQGVAIVPTTPCSAWRLATSSCCPRSPWRCTPRPLGCGCRRRPEHGGGASLFVREIAAQGTNGRIKTGRDRHAGI